MTAQDSFGVQIYSARREETAIHVSLETAPRFLQARKEQKLVWTSLGHPGGIVAHRELHAAPWPSPGKPKKTYTLDLVPFLARLPEPLQ